MIEKGAKTCPFCSNKTRFNVLRMDKEKDRAKIKDIISNPRHQLESIKKKFDFSLNQQKKSEKFLKRKSLFLESLLDHVVSNCGYDFK